MIIVYTVYFLLVVLATVVAQNQTHPPQPLVSCDVFSSLANKAKLILLLGGFNNTRELESQLKRISVTPISSEPPCFNDYGVSSTLLHCDSAGKHTHTHEHKHIYTHTKQITASTHINDLVKGAARYGSVLCFCLSSVCPPGKARWPVKAVGTFQVRRGTEILDNSTNLDQTRQDEEGGLDVGGLYLKS